MMKKKVLTCRNWNPFNETSIASHRLDFDSVNTPLRGVEAYCLFLSRI